MTTKEKIEVMQAFEDGKKVECWQSTGKWLELINPLWNWEKCVYRIKPEPKYMPYGSAEEFLLASKEHGPMVCYEDCIYKQPIQIDIRLDRPIIFSYSVDNKLVDTISFSDLLKFYKWQDGTPCGILTRE